MAIDLADYVDSLKREVTPLGTTLFAAVTDAQWTGYLEDAFWEARLDGFLVGYIAEDGEIENSVSSGPELPRQYVALIVLYAGLRVLRNQILNTQTQFRAKAGPVEFEQQSSATMLAEMLKQLKATKDRIISELDESEETAVLALDAFSVRLFSHSSYWGGLELT